MTSSARNSSVAPFNQLDQLFAAPMFVASMLFLLLTGATLHLGQGQLLETQSGFGCVVGLAVLYPLFVIETIVHYVAGSRNMRQHVWYLLMPIFRLCPRDHVNGTHVWLPRMGWRPTDRALEKKLIRFFSLPMIIIALLVLPVVAFEFFWADMILESPTLTFAMQTATGWIWMAFVFEFVILVSVVDRKLAYCRKNWIDLAVILLPLLSFMRAARLGRLVQLKQLSRTARIYRLRGIALRTWRAIVALEVIDMMLQRDPEYRTNKLQEEISNRQAELAYLRSELTRLQALHIDTGPLESVTGPVPDPDARNSPPAEPPESNLAT